MNTRALALLSLVAISAMVTGCSQSLFEPKTQPHVPSGLRGPNVDVKAMRLGATYAVTLNNGAEIMLRKLGEELFYPVEGTFDSPSFANLMSSTASLPESERNEILHQEISDALKPLKSLKVIGLQEISEIGYVSFYLPYHEDLMSELKRLRFKKDRAFLFNPVHLDRDSLKGVHSFSARTEGFAPSTDPRSNTLGFSGLERMGAPEFVQEASRTVGEKIDGSSVRLGITDTGITLNHPTFDQRIVYLKDFTREGRVYFHPEAKFEATANENEITVQAQILETERLPKMPMGDVLVEVKDLKIKVSPELFAHLIAAGTHAKLGYVSEDAFQAAGEEVDINNNGKLNDKFWMILFPAQDAAKNVVYVDFSGKGDFRNAKPMGDWNLTHDTVSVFAERIGFDIKMDELPHSDGKTTVKVYTASIVGFDPGNHGSHVAGIAAGSSLLARGVAPGAQILLNRVCANNGGCAATSAIADLAIKGQADVINMSLGGLSPFNDGYGVQETVVNRLTSLKNTLFVISAGNSGPGRQTVGSPSVARLSLSVGASASKSMIQRQYQHPGLGSSLDEADPEEDFMLFFSSRGPTAAGGFKPNIAAPGSELSSVQLNTANGSRSAWDVYWGTSMAAPSATGAYTLLLDAIKKYNAKNPSRLLPSNVVTLRQVLISTARPFDVNRFDTVTGAQSLGQYTWIDQGTGMVNLPAAWKKLFDLRDETAPQLEVDYQVLTSAPKNPSGNTYDGTRAGTQGAPAFGTGLYLDYAGQETLKQVYVARRLPERLAAGPDAGELTRQLVTSFDEFKLETVIYGSNKRWLKVGTLDQLDCMSSSEANLMVIGRGVDIKVNADNTGELVPLAASAMNVCLDREMIAHELPAGDNGALIYGYRMVDGKRSTLPSFIVPVSVTVPHQTLQGHAGYEIQRSIKSFGIHRNYVKIPEGTSLVRLELSVPAPKRGVACSGVELMSLQGTNMSNPVASRKEARITNCTTDGAPQTDETKHKIVISRTHPNPGTWDIHIFGSQKFAMSQYTVKVDYVTAQSSVEKIEGGLAALNGSLEWKVRDASLPVFPSSSTSALELTGLRASTQHEVKNEGHIIVPSPMDATKTLRTYPKDSKSVTITTENSPGNDIDLLILECAAEAKSDEDASCTRIASSGGSADVEKAAFTPKDGKVYAIRVDGYAVEGTGSFTSSETIALASETGTVSVAPRGADFEIGYHFDSSQIAKSTLFGSEYFTSGKYAVNGALVIRSEDKMTLYGVPVEIHQ